MLQLVLVLMREGYYYNLLDTQVACSCISIERHAVGWDLFELMTLAQALAMNFNNAE